jgi:iron(III) transport system permease protein
MRHAPARHSPIPSPLPATRPSSAARSRPDGPAARSAGRQRRPQLLVGGTGDTWAHLARRCCPNTSPTRCGCASGSGRGRPLGVTTAWLTVMHEFPGRRFFEWALVLPLAMPAYVMAYVYTDLLQFVGPVQTGCAKPSAGEHGDYWFPDIRTLSGRHRDVRLRALSLRLSADPHRLSRTGERHARSGAHAGHGPWRAFFAVSLPLARPAIVAGVALALMETLADYGTVAYFAVNTFTTGIYRAWFSLGRPRCGGAAGGHAAFLRPLAADGERMSRAARPLSTTPPGATGRWQVPRCAALPRWLVTLACACCRCCSVSSCRPGCCSRWR